MKSPQFRIFFLQRQRKSMIIKSRRTKALQKNIFKGLTSIGGKRRVGVPGYGVRGPGVRGPGVWKTRGLVENAGSGGKRGVRWKTRGRGENQGVWWKTWGLSGKHGGNRIFLTKMRSLNFVILNCNFQRGKSL